MLRNKGRILLRILFCLTLVFIFGHSLMPGGVSGEESGQLLEWLRPFLRLFLKEAWISDSLIRKTAHFAEYAVLGAESGLLADLSDKYESLFRRKDILLTGVFTAFLDETLQLFVSERNGSVRDMWIDVFGFVTGALTAALLRKALPPRKTR